MRRISDTLNGVGDLALGVVDEVVPAGQGLEVRCRRAAGHPGRPASPPRGVVSTRSNLGEGVVAGGAGGLPPRGRASPCSRILHAEHVADLALARFLERDREPVQVPARIDQGRPGGPPRSRRRDPRAPTGGSRRGGVEHLGQFDTHAARVVTAKNRRYFEVRRLVLPNRSSKFCASSSCSIADREPEAAASVPVPGANGNAARSNRIRPSGASSRGVRSTRSRRSHRPDPHEDRHPHLAVAELPIDCRTPSRAPTRGPGAGRPTTTRCCAARRRPCDWARCRPGSELRGARSGDEAIKPLGGPASGVHARDVDHV